MRLDKLTTRFQQALADAQSLAVGRDHPHIISPRDALVTGDCMHFGALYGRTIDMIRSTVLTRSRPARTIETAVIRSPSTDVTSPSA